MHGNIWWWHGLGDGIRPLGCEVISAVLYSPLSPIADTIAMGQMIYVFSEGSICVRKPHLKTTTPFQISPEV